MKDRDNEKKFISPKVKSFLNTDKKRKRVKTVKAVATTALTFSSRLSSRHSKNWHEKKNSKPPRHEKEYTSISFSTSYAKVFLISYSSIRITFSPSQFYQQQSFESTFAFALTLTFTADSASVSATDASIATNLTPLPNPNMPSQF